MKKCSDCQEVKSVEEFGKNRAQKDGLQNICKPCRRARYNPADRKARYDEEKLDPVYLEKARARARQWTRDHRAETTEKVRRWRENNPEANLRQTREANWRFRGIENFTEDDYQELLALQDGRCLECGMTNEEAVLRFRHRLHVDHDHETGEVRGLLCMSCNMKDVLSR